MKFATVVLAPTVLAALLGCGSSGGTSGVIETPPRTFPVCDANGDFQNARPVSDLEEKIRTYIPRVDYFIEASLTDSEYLMYFAGCASDRVPACELLRAHFSIDGEVSYVDYVNPGARSPRHPSISGDGLNLVWSETYGRGARVYAARTDEEFGDVFYDRREILPLPEGSSVRFADPYIARDNRVYVMLGPSSGVSTVHSAPLATDGPAVAYDPKLTGTSPVIDGANRVFLGRYDANTGLRTIVSSERKTGGSFTEPSDRYVKALNVAGTSNYPTWISKDGCRLYFTRGTQESVTTYRIWTAEKPPAKPAK